VDNPALVGNIEFGSGEGSPVSPVTGRGKQLGADVKKSRRQDAWHPRGALRAEKAAGIRRIWLWRRFACIPARARWCAAPPPRDRTSAGS